MFAERECLVLVAGVLVFWDFEPADGAWGDSEAEKDDRCFFTRT
jgi:hypothetical protein